MKASILLTATMLILGTLSAHPKLPVTNSNPLSIEITCLQKVPIVEFQLNGKIAYFVLDTGSDISIVNRSGKRNYGFKVQNTASKDLKGFSGERHGLYKVTGATLSLQGQQLSTKFYSADLSHLVETLKNQTSIEISGIIGLDVMKAYDFKINYQSGKLIFNAL